MRDFDRSIPRARSFVLGSGAPAYPRAEKDPDKFGVPPSDGRRLTRKDRRLKAVLQTTTLLDKWCIGWLDYAVSRRALMLARGQCLGRKAKMMIQELS